MKKNHPRHFRHKTWTPSDLQGLCGLSPVNLRDLRRRDLVPKEVTRKFKLETVSQLFLLAELTAHGFGPKSIKAVTEQFAEELRQHALQHRSAWADDRSHSAWLKSAFGKPPKTNFILMGQAGEQAIAAIDLAGLRKGTSATVTVVDLGKLGARLGKHLALRPSLLADRTRDASQ